MAVVHLSTASWDFCPSRRSSPRARIRDLPEDAPIYQPPEVRTRLLLDYHLQKGGIDPSSIPGYENEVYTHFEAGLAILAGQAGAGIATVAVSRLLALPFAPIVRESFDMVLTKETFFKKGVQAFIAALNSADFRAKVAALGTTLQRLRKNVYSRREGEWPFAPAHRPHPASPRPLLKGGSPLAHCMSPPLHSSEL